MDIDVRLTTIGLIATFIAAFFGVAAYYIERHRHRRLAPAPRPHTPVSVPAFLAPPAAVEQFDFPRADAPTPAVVAIEPAPPVVQSPLVVVSTATAPLSAASAPVAAVIAPAPGLIPTHAAAPLFRKLSPRGADEFRASAREDSQYIWE